MSIIVAVEMSTQPFKTFQFDGILGLGLAGLTMNRTGRGELQRHEDKDPNMV